MPGNGARPRVGISGHHRFVTLFLRASGAVPEWELRGLDVRSWRARVASLRDFFRCDLWYTIGTSKATVWFELLAFLLRKPRVVHWVGSDITALGRFPPYRWLWSARGNRRTLHVSEIDWTMHELTSYGLASHTVSLPVHLGSGKPAPLPRVFTILFYIPAGYESFYGAQYCERLIELCRNRPVKFIVVGGGRLRVRHSDAVEQIRWAETAEELDDAYERSTMLVRITPRDGLSCMVLEALSRGRYVVWSKPFPHARTAQSFEDVHACVEELLARFTSGALLPDDEAAAYVQERYDASKTVRALSAHWRSVLLAASR